MRKILVLSAVMLLVMAFRSGTTNVPEYPKTWPSPNYNFTVEGFTPAKAEVGRLLFYDPILSADSMVSCASCHSPYNSFAHTDHALSHGIHDSIGTRNAPALINLAWQQSYMWDGAIHHLDFQALAPMTNKAEMGENFPNVILKLNRSAFYKEEFKAAFGDTIISGPEILKSLSMFMASLISQQSKYDSVMNHTAKFTEQEQHGYLLFRQHCNRCHQEPLFTNGQFAANGLTVDSLLDDKGRERITGNPADAYLFKVPTLRNIAFTPPYMHDGRFKNLRQVLQHYTSEKKQGVIMSPEIETAINISPNDKTDLIAFLISLSDRSFMFNPQFSFPSKLLPKTANK